MSNIVIIGAGPSGIAAASVFTAHGVTPILLDEAESPGGQIHRKPAAGIKLNMQDVLASDYRKFQDFHFRAENVCSRSDYRPRHLAWAVHNGEVWTTDADGGTTNLPFSALVVATGATDRIFPVKGWTLPGVYALGGAQALLKHQGCLIGRRVVFCGSSPLLYLAALQYLRVGGRVEAIIDTTPAREKFKATPQLLWSVQTLMQGLSYMGGIHFRKIRVEHGAVLEEMIPGGEDIGVCAVQYRNSAGARRTIECDAVALGHGLRPESQLAELAGCQFFHDPALGQWIPQTDDEGRGPPRVYLAGDGARIGGADAAELTGKIAACAALTDLGIKISHHEPARLKRKLRRLRKFQSGLSRAFAWPAQRAGELPDDTIICRCESVSAGTLRHATRAQFGALEANRLKALTRCGMGRCQGRYCEFAATEVSAACLGISREQLGRLRAQAPVKPIPVSTGSADGH